MSDFRNPNGFNAAPMAPEEMNSEINSEIRLTEAGFGEQHELVDNGGLSSFHHFEEEEEGSSKAKMIGGGLVVALLLGAAGIYTMSGSGNAPVAMKAPASQVASNAPVQTAPTPAAMPAPVAPDMTANTPAEPATSPYDAAPVAKAPASNTASVAPDVEADEPVMKTAGKSKTDAARNQAESEQTAQLNKAADMATKNGSATEAPAAPASDVAAATPAPVSPDATPLPTPPAPPASSVAANGQSVGTQSAPQDMPVVTPEQQAAPAPAQPEQAAQPEAQPAPAQPQ